MAVGGSLQLSHEFGVFSNYGQSEARERLEMKRWRRLSGFPVSSCDSHRDVWSLRVADRIYRPMHHVSHRHNVFMCRSFAIPSSGHEIPLLKYTTLALTRSYNALRESPLILQLGPAVGIIVFAAWGLGPLMRYCRNLFLHNDSNWKKSRTHYVLVSYLQPLLLWTGATMACRALDPVVLPSEASQAVKQRLLNFVRSLSTVLAFAYCLSSLIQQTQKLFKETSGSGDTRNMTDERGCSHCISDQTIWYGT